MDCEANRREAFDLVRAHCKATALEKLLFNFFLDNPKPLFGAGWLALASAQPQPPFLGCDLRPL
jgi:hypothetical protein